jgi:hypothetical protein
MAIKVVLEDEADENTYQNLPIIVRAKNNSGIMLLAIKDMSPNTFKGIYIYSPNGSPEVGLCCEHAKSDFEFYKGMLTLINRDK